MTEKFSEYLTGAEVIVMTDNNPLAHLDNAKLGALEQRWMARLSKYTYQIKYRSGRENANADALSRVTPDDPGRDRDGELEDSEIPHLGKIPVFVVLARTSGVVTDRPVLLGKTHGDWVYTQNDDVTLRQIKQWVKAKKWPTPIERKQLTPHGARVMQQWDRLKLEDGLLYRKVYLETEWGLRWQLVIPSISAREVAREAHIRGAHFSPKKTYKWLQRFVYCPGLELTVQDVCRTCRACELAKPPEQRAPTQTIRTTTPLEVLMIDYILIGHSNSGHQYCLVMTDHFTKFAVAVATRDQTAESAAQAVCKQFIQLYGCPNRIHSDQGACFQGRLMSELYRMYGIHRSRTTPYHPEGNGACERFNRTLLQMLRTLEGDQKARWPECLPELLWAYNNRVHSTTGYTPYMMLFGRPGREIEDLNLTTPESGGACSPDDWVGLHRRRLQTIHRLVINKTRLTSHPDKTPVQHEPFQPGDRVLVRAKRPSGKLGDRWEAMPYRVRRRVNPDGPVYEVEPENGEGVTRVLHRNMLRPCHSETSPTEPGSTAPRSNPTAPVFTPVTQIDPDEWWAVPVPVAETTPAVVILPPREGTALFPAPAPEPVPVVDLTDAPTLRRTPRSNAGVPPQRYAQDEFVWGGLSRTPTSSGVVCQGAVNV